MPAYVPLKGFPVDMDKVTTADGNASDVNQGNAILGDKYCQLFWVGGTGDVTIMLENGSTKLFDAVAAGEWHMAPPFRNVQATNTDATDITVATIY